MPKYANHFAGHIEHGDPRTPVTAAAGCLWPTMPAHRYLLTSQDASGMFLALNTVGVLFSKSTVGPGHDLCQWSGMGMPPPFVIAIAIKQAAPNKQTYTWTVTLSALGVGLAIKTVEFPLGDCNLDRLIGLFGFANPFLGNTGFSCQLQQVEFDHTEPPGGFP